MRDDVSLFRLYLMRALYALIFVYLTTLTWPMLFGHRPYADMMHGVSIALLAALGLLMGLGIRYPLKMLPVLLFEFLWKAIWVVMIGFPLWRAHALDADNAENWKACLVGVVLCLIAIPWGYVWRNYVKPRGDRWIGRSSAAVAS